MLKRHIFTPLLLLSLSLTPFACTQQQVTATLDALHAQPKVSVQAPSPPGPTICVNHVCHSKRWWDQFAAFIKAAAEQKRQQDLVAFYEAVSTPYHTGTYNGYACGGDLPSCCTVQIESHGNPYAVEPGHMGAPYGDPGDPWTHASGLVQFMPGTWAGFHGYAYAAAAPVHDQYLREAEVFNHGLGASNWYGDGCYNGG